jgi:uncharacterized protein (TIGR02453 family)
VAFQGFPAEAVAFYEGLEADNSKGYWQAHKAVYADSVLRPMEQLLAGLAPEFGEGKVFRPYRDVRFSADKSPYKTAIAATLARGGYVQFSADGLAAGCGAYMLAPDQLERYRRAVDDERTGAEVAGLVAALQAAGIEVTAHDTLKTSPKGFARDHPRVELLRRKGLVGWRQWPADTAVGNPAVREWIEEFLHACAPLARWLARHVGDSSAPERARR